MYLLILEDGTLLQKETIEDSDREQVANGTLEVVQKDDRGFSSLSTTFTPGEEPEVEESDLDIEPESDDPGSWEDDWIDVRKAPN